MRFPNAHSTIWGRVSGGFVDGRRNEVWGGLAFIVGVLFEGPGEWIRMGVIAAVAERKRVIEL